MDPGALVREQIEVAARFLEEFHQYAPIRAAAWFKDAEEGRWDLYIVSDEITDTNLDVAYGEVARIARHLRDPWFDPFRIKLISKDDPVARSLRDVVQRYPGRPSGYLPGSVFRGLHVKAAYFYTPPLAGMPR